MWHSVGRECNCARSDADAKAPQPAFAWRAPLAVGQYDELKALSISWIEHHRRLGEYLLSLDGGGATCSQVEQNVKRPRLGVHSCQCQQPAIISIFNSACPHCLLPTTNCPCRLVCSLSTLKVASNAVAMLHSGSMSCQRGAPCLFRRTHARLKEVAGPARCHMSTRRCASTLQQASSS